MSRLQNPGIGEVSDRLTILALKIRYGLDAGRDISHFQRESAGLQTKIRSATLNGSWFEFVLQLGAVNARLWALEDQMQEYEKQYTLQRQPPEGTWTGTTELSTLLREAGLCGIQIRRLNAERARLVEAINAQTGDPHEEKQG